MNYKATFAHMRELYSARHEPENARALARIYWHVLLAASLFVLIGIVAAATMQFIVVADALYETSVSAPRPNVLDRSKLTATLEAWDAREEEFARYRPPALADPSR